LSRPRITGKELLAAASVLVVFSGSAWLSSRYTVDLRGGLASSSITGMALYVVLTIAAVVVLPVSTLPLLPVAVNLWGSSATAGLSVAGWVVGAAIAFGLARRYGRPFVGKLVSLRRVERIENAMPKSNLFWAVVFLRIALPVDLLSYAVGLFTAMPFAPYMAATVLGVVPFAVVFSFTAAMDVGWQIAGGLLGAAALLFGFTKAADRPPGS